jgi:predicted P-loop ATPase
MLMNGHAAKAEAAQIMIQDRGRIDWPELTEKGGVKGRSQQNIAAFLGHIGAELAFNGLAHCTVVRRQGRETLLTDEAAKGLWLEADAMGLASGETYFVAVLENTGRRNAFHPVRDYLASLEWDGIERLDTWLSAYLDAEDTELNRAYGRKTLIGAVRRVRYPGAKHDTVLVLQGLQGKGKSSAICALCPDEEWFSDSLGIGDDQKQVIEHTAGKWLVEMAELAGMGKRDANVAKSMISRKVDRARLSYGRLNTERPRQFVLFGTVNEAQYLRDQTGNRRYWPVSISGKLDPDKMCEAIARDRDQLWAEAAFYEARRESPALQKHLWQTAAESQRERMLTDPWQERLETYLDGKEFATSEEMYEALGVLTAQRNPSISQRIAGILTGMGYERVRRQIDARRVWGYERLS